MAAMFFTSRMLAGTCGTCPPAKPTTISRAPQLTQRKDASIVTFSHASPRRQAAAYR